MTASATLTTTACGAFFMIALLTGAWKWRAMLASADHLAPVYVDTAHRSSLLYSFACLVLFHFVGLSPLPEAANVLACGLPILFFAVAIGTYLRLGWHDRTDNQFERREFATTTGTALLALSEIGGFAVLFGAFLVSRFG